MYLAGRLRQFRQAKDLSQGDIEKRTGLLRCYISRVENGHTVPSIETLEKISRALEVPLYHLFYEDKDSSEVPISSNNGETDWASHGKGRRLFMRLRLALSRIDEPDRQLLLHLAKKMSQSK